MMMLLLLQTVVQHHESPLRSDSVLEGPLAALEQLHRSWVVVEA
jgi:hypothetical protein